MNLPIVLSSLLAFGGMLTLCLGLERHFKQLLNSKPPRQLLQVLRMAGWLALAASLYTSTIAWGWAMGPVGWFGLVSISGLVLTLLSPFWKFSNTRQN